MRNLEHAITSANAVIYPGREIPETKIQRGVVLKRQILASKQTKPHRAPIIVPLVYDLQRCIAGTKPVQPGFSQIKSIIKHQVVIALHITDIIDIKVPVKERAVEGVLDSASGTVIQVKEHTFTRVPIDIAMQQLSVKNPAGIRREQ